MRLRGIIHGLVRQFLQHSVPAFQRHHKMRIQHTSCFTTGRYISVHPLLALIAANSGIPPSILTRSIIHHPHIRHQPFQALLELPVRRVLLDIVLPVLLARKLHHKRVRVPCLLARQPPGPTPSTCHATSRNLHHPEAQKRNTLHAWVGKKNRDRNTNSNKSIYLLILNAILLSPGRSRDVRLLRGGMDALVAQIHHALACLFQVSTFTVF